MKPLLLLPYLLPLWGCSQFGVLDSVTPLPRSVDECSGIYSYNGSTFWALEDGGNSNKRRERDTLGNILRSLEVDGVKNNDWEALTADTLGNLYIGDFGNNKNERTDLAIYRVPDPRALSEDQTTVQVIGFSYPDQKAFPPKKKGLFFDAEAFFYHGGFLYIITKNRARESDGTATVYRVPDQPGNYMAEIVARIRLCDDSRTCQVTDAALSPDGSRLVLLGYGKLWVYEPFSIDGLGRQQGRLIDLQTNTQLESVCFATDTLLLLADERSLGRGGNLYRMPLPRPE